jgi:hypothetical protein
MFKAASFGEFTAQAARQRVALDGTFVDRVIESVDKKRRAPQANSLADPKHMLTAIRVGARLRQLEPGHSLATGPIELDVFGKDFLALALGQLVNNAGAPEGETPVQLPASKGQMSSCAKTEGGFAKAVRGLVHNPKATGAQLITDPSNQVVAIRKGKQHGVSSALTLVPTEAGDIYVPAGSVVRLDVAGDAHDSEGRPVVTAASPRIVPIEDVTGMAYRRPTAFALPADQRMAHFGPELLQVQSLNIDTIAFMAQTALASLEQQQAV